MAFAGLISSGLGMAASQKGQRDSANAMAERGDRMQKVANFEADQLDINAGQAQASAQRKAADVGRKFDMMQSRGLALAAAGGGAGSADVINLMAKNSGLGAYQRAVALYEGDSAARDMKMRAEATRFGGQLSAYDGQNAKNAGMMAADASLLKEAASMYSKYAQPAPYESNASGFGGGSGTNDSGFWGGDDFSATDPGMGPG